MMYETEGHLLTDDAPILCAEMNCLCPECLGKDS